MLEASTILPHPRYVPLSILFVARRDDFVGQVGNLRPIVNRPGGSNRDAGDTPAPFVACRYVGQAILPRMCACATVLLIGSVAAPAQISTAQMVSRIEEEAALFQANLPKSLTQETLTQRAWMPPSRFQPRSGAMAVTIPRPRLVSHEVVSEYSVGPLKNSDSHNLFEFRQVISVDGKAVRSVESARRELTLGIRSQDDAVRKRMLQDYAKYGLVDVATDYGLILLAFTKRGMEGLEIEPAGQDRIGADAMLIFNWKQSSSDAGELEFRGRQANRRALQGRLWVRAADGLPLRVQAWTEYVESKRHIRDEATVDYIVSTHGFLTPASVAHRHIIDRQIITENLYHYDPFKLFGADSELKFTEPSDPPIVKK